MHVNCADFVYKAMGELIQVLYLIVEFVCKVCCSRAVYSQQ